MIQRCTNPNSNRYYLYGARGITICERWQDFQNFLADMGPRLSADYSIERLNNSGNYEPENCKWATCSEQAINRRSNRLVTIDGITKCVSEWAREASLDCFTIFKRLRRGESGASLLRSHERKMTRGEFTTCRKGLHAFPEWRRDVKSGSYCVLCKRQRDGEQRRQRRAERLLTGLESERR